MPDYNHCARCHEHLAEDEDKQLPRSMTPRWHDGVRVCSRRCERALHKRSLSNKRCFICNEKTHNQQTRSEISVMNRMYYFCDAQCRETFIRGSEECYNCTDRIWCATARQQIVIAGAVNYLCRRCDSPIMRTNLGESKEAEPVVVVQAVLRRNLGLGGESGESKDVELAPGDSKQPLPAQAPAPSKIMEELCPLAPGGPRILPDAPVSEVPLELQMARLLDFFSVGS